MNCYPYQGKRPLLPADGFVAPGAVLIGDVTLGEGSSVWYNAVLRGDVCGIRVGKHSNIQDNSTVHTASERMSGKEGGIPAVIGDYVTVGHGCVIHACTIEDYCLIGMGATVLDGAVVGRGSVIGAGSVVTKGTVIPPFSVAVGIPARVVKTLDEKVIASRLDQAEHYFSLAAENRESIAAGEDG